LIEAWAAVAELVVSRLLLPLLLLLDVGQQYVLLLEILEHSDLSLM
jgi:hypothetical protein